MTDTSLAVADLARLAERTAILSDLVDRLGMARTEDNQPAIDEVARVATAADMAMRLARTVAPLPRAERRSAVAEMRAAVAGSRADFLAAGARASDHAFYRDTFGRMLDGCLDANRTGNPLQITFKIDVEGEPREVVVATYTPPTALVAA